MRVRRVAISAVLLALLGSTACAGGGGWFREYEYDEETYLSLDGSATIVVSSSLWALRELHGFDVPTDPAAPIDREAIGRLFESAVTSDVYVSRPWRRHGRAYVSVEVQTGDITRVSEAAPFRWSQYSLMRQGDGFVYRQRIGAPAAAASGDGPWRGDEIVAFRLHLPSKVLFHNSPSGEVERGNIVVWEQPLPARLDGEPVAIEVRVHGQTILYRTLIIFALALASALSLLWAAAWWLRRKGRRSPARADGRAPSPGLTEQVDDRPTSRAPEA